MFTEREVEGFLYAHLRQAGFGVREKVTVQGGIIDAVPWPGLVVGNRGGVGVSIPNQVPGVYEVRDSGADDSERLYIGKAGDLRLRVRQGLVKGKIPHPGGARIRAQEDVARLIRLPLKMSSTRRIAGSSAGCLPT